MDPGEYNFTIYQGANDGLTFTMLNDGTPIDLTDYDVKMMIRKNYDSNQPYFIASTLNTPPNITVTPSLGQIQVYIYPADTNAIVFKGEELDCVYEIEITSPTGVITRVLEGAVTISREVVR